jgi:hypothetical protein
MEKHNCTFLQVLRIHCCDLWQVKDGHATLKTKGALEVLYSTVLDMFIIRVNDFKFALDKPLQIIGMFDEKDNCLLYMLPTFDGFFTLKVFNAHLGPLITNFETILKNCCHFIRKSGLEQKLGEKQSFLQKAGEVIKEGFIAADFNLLESHSKMQENESHPNHRIVRTFSELKDVDSQGTPVIDIPLNEVQNLKDECQEVIGKHQGYPKWSKLSGVCQPSMDQATYDNQPVGPHLHKPSPTDEKSHWNEFDSFTTGLMKRDHIVESMFDKVIAGSNKDLGIPSSGVETKGSEPSGPLPGVEKVEGKDNSIPEKMSNIPFSSFDTGSDLLSQPLSSISNPENFVPGTSTGSVGQDLSNPPLGTLNKENLQPVSTQPVTTEKGLSKDTKPKDVPVGKENVGGSCVV